MSYEDVVNVDEEEHLLDATHEAPAVSLFLIVASTSCATFLFGYSLGFTSPLFDPNDWEDFPSGVPLNATYPNITHDKFLDVQMQMNDDDRTWFGSVINLGAGFGAVLAGGPVDRFGKRSGIIVANVLFIVGYLLILTTPVVVEHYSDLTYAEIADGFNTGRQVAQLLLARVVIGFAIGITCCTVGNYQIEISTLDSRGRIGTCFQLAVTVGFVVVNAIGIVCTWQTICNFAFGVAIAGAVSAVFIPESPVWLLSKGRYTEAEDALRKLRTADSDVEGLLLDTRRSITDTERHEGGFRDLLIAPRGMQSGETTRCIGFQTVLVWGLFSGTSASLITTPATGKALLLVIALMVMQQASGINAVMFYTSQILGLVWEDDSKINSIVTVLRLVQMLVTLACAPLMDRVGRKPLLMSAATCLCISIAIMNTYFFDTSNPKMLCVVGLFAYSASFSLGMGAIPWAMMGELLHPDVKGVASSIVTLTNWMLSFAVTKTVSRLQIAFGDGDTGEGWVFTLYGIVCFLGIPFIYFVVPETKGKSYRVLEMELMGYEGYAATDT